MATASELTQEELEFYRAAIRRQRRQEQHELARREQIDVQTCSASLLMRIEREGIQL